MLFSFYLDAKASMVFGCHGHAYSSTNLPAKDTRFTDSVTCSSPSIPQYGTDGMQGVWQAITSQGLSVRATSIIMLSRSGATQAQYTTYLKRWKVFWNEWQVNPTNPFFK